MSSRALRRLERDKGVNSLELRDDVETQEDGEDLTSSRPSFSLLADSDSTSTTSSEMEANGEKEAMNELKNPSEKVEDAASRRRRRKRGSKKALELQHENDHDNIDEFLRNLALEKETSSQVNEDNGMDNSLVNSVFMIDLDNLDPAVELRRKVGGGVDKDDSSGSSSQLPDIQQMSAASARRLNAMIKNKTKVRRHRKQLIVPRPLWPKVTSAMAGLRLRRINHCLYGKAFELVPKTAYAQQFEEFVELVGLGDIELIYAFVQKFPLHVDALLVMSDYLRMSSATDAIELTERAVYILEKCMLATDESGVDLTSGNLQLPYDLFENRRMHLALIKYIQFLTKRGCYRTAFELGKILWSLDPLVDPIGVRLIIDFLALQSEQFDWFDLAYPQVGADTPWLANWHFSAALKWFNQDSQYSHERLQDAILAHPWMIPSLADSCGLQLDEDNWTSTFKIPILSPHDHVRGVREAMAKIYAQRCGPLWKLPKNCAWLETNIGIALSTQLSIESPSMKNYRPAVMEVLSIFRHTIISDLTNVQVSIPVSISSDSIHLYDPLPPEQVLDEDLSTSASKCIIQ